MAKLPSAIDLQRKAAPTSTPAIKAPKIDYSPMAKAAESLGTGLKSVGTAVNAYVQAGEQDEAHELDRRLLDFKLQSELDLEEQKRSMPEGGAGFTSSWLDTYREKAKAFVGDRYGNIPEKYRAQVDNKLTAQEVMLHERAQREEWAERDRQTVADLGVTLGRTRSAVEANPDRLEEMWSEGKRLIDTSNLSPAVKSKAARDYRTQLEEASATAIASNVTDAESYARAKDMLAPHKAERVTSRRVAEAITSGKALGGPSGWAATNPTWKRLDRYTKAAVMALMEADGADIDDAKNALGAMINRAGKSGEDLGAHVSRKIYQPTIEPAQERRLERILHSPKVAELADWARRRAEGREPDPVNGATHFLASERTMLALEAKEPRKYKSWRSWTGFDPSTGSYRGVITRDKSHAFLAPEGSAEDAGTPTEPSAELYAGPYQHLSLAKRRAIWGQAEAQFDKVKKGVESVIKKQMEVSGDGYMPPEPILQELDRQVRAIGDPMLAAQYDTMLRQAQLTQRLQKAPPQAIEEQARVLRDMASSEGATPEMVASAKHVEKVAEAVRKNVNDDPMTWAHRTQIMVPTGNPATAQGSFRSAQEIDMAPVKLEQLNFGSPQIDMQLEYRMDQAREVGRYYDQPAKVFTKAERDALTKALRQGGDGMLFVLGTISNAAARAGIEPADVMKEFSKDAPEVAVIGQAVVSGADPRTLDTAAKALSWRIKQGDKFVSTIDKAQAKPNLDEYADVLSATPTKVDAVRATANLVYEYEARRQGKEAFDQGLYSTVVRRLMGETTDRNGKTYGGVGDQGTGWSDGKIRSGGWFGGTPKVMVPAGVRTDSFDDMVSAIRMKDLAGDPPLDGNGRPIPISAIRSATWISVGPGLYGLKMGADEFGKSQMARNPDGSDYALDIRRLLPALKRRKPEIFEGYDGSQRPEIEPDAVSDAVAKRTREAHSG